MRRISIIVAMDQNGVIGNQGHLPWKLPDDLKRFKQITLGHSVIMGRKTFQSIGHPLPGRSNFVISRQVGFSHPGVCVSNSLEEAIRQVSSLEEIFVIGGAEIYSLAIPYISRIYLTRIHSEALGDVVFPSLDWTKFTEISREDRSDPIAHSYSILDCKQALPRLNLLKNHHVQYDLND